MNNTRVISDHPVFLPEYKSVLDITPEFHVYQTRKPNRWHRFWYRVLLGWTWREVRHT